MSGKYVPTQEELELIKTCYATYGTYAQVSRSTGLSQSVVKRIIEENDFKKESVKLKKLIYNKEEPAEPENPFYLTFDFKKEIIQLNDSIKSAYHKVQKVIASYGKRAEAAASDNGVDWKAISHCVRVLLQVEELLTTNKITFPLINANFIKSIKYNTTDMSYEEIMSWIETHIWHIDEVLLPKSTLREKADYKWIEKFILNCYGFANIIHIEDPNIQNIRRRFENKMLRQYEG